MFKFLSKLFSIEEGTGIPTYKNPPPPPHRKSILEMTKEERKLFLKEAECKRMFDPEIRAYELNKKKLDTELKVAILNFLSSDEPNLNLLCKADNKADNLTVFEYIYFNIRDL